jgi:hypothetical protein
VAHEQRNAVFSSAPIVPDWLAPWRVPTARRRALLDWFLGAEIGSTNSVARLRKLTGRVATRGAWRLPDDRLWVWAENPKDPVSAAHLRREQRAEQRMGREIVIGDPATIPPGLEEGRLAPAAREVNGVVRSQPVTPEEFIRFYGDAQFDLNESRQRLYEYAKNRRILDQAIELPLFGFLADVRIGPVLVRRGPEPWEWGVAGPPPRGELQSISLIGELALAMFQLWVEGRECVLCPSCGEIKFFPDVRNRVICDEPECRLWYRAKWTREQYAANKKTTTTRKSARKAAKR